MTEGTATKPKPISHRKPDLKTVRELYGTAFRCGKPGCGKPLYTMNNDTGETLLNSEVAHICARSEGGPRWDADMTEAENRSASNLIPLCLDHAREIDATPEHYSVELLHGWKRTQLDEHAKIQKAWPLTEDEAQQVSDASFRPDDYGTAIAAASSVTAAARAVGHLVETARQQRRVPFEAAASWHAMRTRVHRSMPRPWNATTGEPLPPIEPSHMETVPYARRLDEALDQVVKSLSPLAATLVAELHAVRAAVTRVAAWCDWVETAASAVLVAAGRWPGRPPENDDQVHADAIAELVRASEALSAVWRGQQAEQPPEPPEPSPEPVETDLQRLLREHSQLLDRSRPWARVTGRQYDPDLYAELLHAAQFAVALPPLLMFLHLDLETTAALASKVARNADDATFASLIDDAAAQEPLAIAVRLTQQLMFVAQKKERADLEGKAREHVTRLLLDADWTDQALWVDNRHHVRALLSGTASISTDDEVRDRLASAITRRPELLDAILLGVSEQSEQHDHHDFSRVVGINVHIKRPPRWFPAAVVAAEIRRRHPELQPADPDDDHSDEDDVRHLAAQVLHIETHAP
ncbi:hypothetical protein [Asanoa siamensis]|uniref:hypothetical protein n=1 Tax=Asanoa siamensis TaxID=926357 RepID=UPI0019406B67|nr:hypothetical protein [Asanoa siamensis]